VSQETLKLWSNFLKGAETSNTSTHSLGGVEFDCDSDDADNDFAELLPTLTFAESASERLVSDLASRVGPHPSPTDIVNLITEVLPLNDKQKFSVAMVLYQALRHQGKNAVEFQDQALRHSVNYHSIVAFARYRSQQLYIFPGFDTILPSTQCQLLEEIFSQQDDGVNIPAPGLLLYTPNMPCIVISNIISGLVNGTRGTASGIIPESESRYPLFFEDLLLSSTTADYFAYV
jgi:hypothetical protein